jgi:hypothetical protein
MPQPAPTEVIVLPREAADNSTQAETESILSGLPALLEKQAQEAAEKKEGTETKEAPEVKVETKEVKPSEITPEPEIKPETKAEIKEEKKVDKPKFEDLSDEAIDKQVKGLPTNKAETQRRYRELLGELKTAREEGTLTKKEFEQAQKDLTAAKKEAEDAVKKAIEPEDVKKQREEQVKELAMLRRQYQLENDPTIKKQYDEVVTAAETEITSVLTSGGLDKASLDLITKEGGWLAFSRSGKPLSWRENDPENPGTLKVINGTLAQYAAKIKVALTTGDQDMLSAKVQEQITTRSARDRYVAEEKGKAKEYFEQQAKTAQGSQADLKTRVEQLQKDYAGQTEKAIKEGKEYDFLRDREVPAKATAAEKTVIEAHNTSATQLRQFIADAPAAQTPELFSKLALYAARGLYAEKAGATNAKEVETLTKQVKDLQAELTKVRSAGRTVPKGGGVGTGGGAPEKPEKKGQSADEAIDDIVSGLGAKVSGEE